VFKLSDFAFVLFHLAPFDRNDSTFRDSLIPHAMIFCKDFFYI